MVVAIEPLRIAYMAVPKAACTSVKAALAAVDPNVPRGAELLAADPLEVHKIYPTMRFRRHRWVTYQGWFRFTVVRDPLARLLSVYSDRIVARSELHNARKFRRGRAPLPQDPDPDFFFQNLDGYIGWSSVIKHHVLPQAIFTGPELNRFSRIYRTSDLAALAGDLSEVAGTGGVIPQMNASHHRLSFDALKPATQIALRRRLEPEYEHLADYFDPPWARPQAAIAGRRAAV